MYVLTHSYVDRSAFHICGVTANRDIAETWYAAGDDNDVYEINEHANPVSPYEAHTSWKDEKRVEEIQEGDANTWTGPTHTKNQCDDSCFTDMEHTCGLRGEKPPVTKDRDDLHWKLRHGRFA